MTTIRRINVSQIEGDSANNTNTNEIRPFGETAFYLDTNGNTDKLVLMMFDGTRTHRKSKVLSPGELYGSNADSGDGNNYDTLKLIPDADLFANGSDQYLIIDPTGPNHIHIRAGGTQDNSSSQLFIGGENSYLSVGAGIDPPIYIKSNNNTWEFGTNGYITFPDLTVQTTAWRLKSVPASSIGAAGDKLGDIAFNSSYMYYCTQNFVEASYSSTISISYSGTFPSIVKGSIPQPQAGWVLVHNGNSYTLDANATEGNPGEWTLSLSSSISVTIGDSVTIGPASAQHIWKRVAWSVDTW